VGRLWRFSLSLGLTGGLLALLMLWGGVSPLDALAALGGLSPRTFLAALGIHLGTYLMRAVRFHVLIPPEERPPFRRSVVVSAAHNMASYVLPAKTGEATFVLYMKAHAGVSSTAGITSLLVSRLLDGATLSFALALACFVLAASGRQPHLEWLGALGGGLSVATMTFVVLSLRGDFVVRALGRLLRLTGLSFWARGARLLERMKRIADAVRLTGGSRRLIPAALASMGIWGCVFAFYAYLGHALGLPSILGLAEMVLGASLAMLCNLLPVNGVAGVGTQETGWVLGFSEGLGVSPDLALSTGIAVHLVQLFNIVVLGLIAHIAMGVVPRLGAALEAAEGS